MNRLVIIGNGFDLAHGLPTSYRDFIDDFWKNFKEKNDSEIYQKFVFTNEEYNKYYRNYGEIDNFLSFKESIKECINEYPEYSFNENQFIFYNSKYANRKIIFKFKNDFFRQINIKSIENWVDIENEYFRLLKVCLNDNKSISELNREFDEVKMLLQEYLINNIEDKFEFSSENIEEILNVFKTKSYEGDEIKNLYDEISINGRKLIKERYKDKIQKATGYGTNNYSGLKISFLNFFLSFNYTSTLKRYIDFLNIDSGYLNEIHGSLTEKINPVNFGFGDEMDNDYKQIEDKNDNEYLKNIKSFQYLHTQNYKRLLNVIDSDLFQVYLMGHSCGLSDRTLLNTIFEHENCCSIKIYYHQKEDGSDNYTEITQNISRHFNDKKLMREKIVNKTLCKPLPQIQLPKK